jgi:hypothetical protein
MSTSSDQRGGTTNLRAVAQWPNRTIEVTASGAGDEHAFDDFLRSLENLLR